MGLDMFLWRDIYIGADYPHNGVTGKIELFKNNEPVEIDVSKVAYVREVAGYWRKCWTIHRWLVNNIQDGDDNCGTYYADTGIIENLVALCYEALGGDKEALEELNITSMDEDIIYELNEAVSVLTKALEDDRGELYYSSSW